MTKISKTISAWPLAASIVLAIGGTACSTSSQRPNTYKTSEDPRPIVDDKYRLTADRKELDEMRAQVPPDRKAENDEIAFTMQLMENPEKNPSDVREKFDSALRKKRERIQKDFQKEREDFTNKERKDREQFLKGLADERTEFLRSKHNKEDRDEFFSKQDEKRKEYFETQRERRNDYEADVHERRKNFDDYAREKNTEFMQEWRAYQKRYDEYQKVKKAQAAEKAMKNNPTANATGTGVPTNEPMPEVKSFLQEFMDIPSAPGTNLESGANGQ